MTAQRVATFTDIFSTTMAVEQEAQMHQGEMLALRDSQGKGKAISGGSGSSDRRGGAWKN